MAMLSQEQIHLKFREQPQCYEDNATEGRHSSMLYFLYLLLLETEYWISGLIHAFMFCVSGKAVSC